MSRASEGFERLGIRREQDLVLHLPIRYEDDTRITPIAQLRVGERAQIEGLVEQAEIVRQPRRMLVVRLRDAQDGRIELRFLHFWPAQRERFANGALVRAQGEVRGGLFGLELVHPRWRIVRPGTPLPEQLTPVYPTVAGIGQDRLRAAIADALRRWPWPELLPDALRARLALPAIDAALQTLHAPPAGASVEALAAREGDAWRRVIFDELLAQQLSLRRARRARASLKAPPLGQLDALERMRAALPFSLTAAQQRALSPISADLARDQPMNRLLQGDVGSGKTAVAALAAAQAIGSGWQVALMAPTELLAEQHLRKLSPLAERAGMRLAWLSGSMRESAKKAVRAEVASGQCDLLIGTHALIEDTVAFARLGLAIVDEQHRFGVLQRLALRDKREGELIPHQLMMSATPIPRTLAMSYYADLDVSVIDELPPGRRPVRTRLVTDTRRAEVIERMRAAIDAGRQVYWVCPLIEESEAIDLRDAQATFETLSAELDPTPVGLLHGRMAGADKQATMQAFASGALKVLVATTVIEVGVDVPAASLMVVEHAERFGLAQLHQLRGRVGRGTTDSDCVLMYRPPLSAAARDRLKALYETTDGFELARRDLVQRGPGELLGARQSGQLLLRFADLERDAALVEQARETAEILLAGEPAIVDAHLDRWLGGREDYLKV